MDVSEPTPRVNFELMQRHMHKKVLLVGQIESRDNNVARLRAADGGIVQVMVQPGVMFESKFIQFEGIVESPTQLSALNHTNFGDNLGKDACMHLQGPSIALLSCALCVQMLVCTMSSAKSRIKTFLSSSFEIQAFAVAHPPQSQV